MNLSTKKLCSRHNPQLRDVYQMSNGNSDQLQKELNGMPLDIQQRIHNTWSIFSAASPDERDVILKGILSLSCTPQLVLLSNNIQTILRMDFARFLPPEICMSIFSYLDAKSLCRAAQVCRHWKSIADNDVVWRRMCEQHINTKCTKCGWGLPLLQKQNLRKRPRSHSNGDSESTSHRLHRKSWKTVYGERLVLECNWRKNRSSITIPKRHHQDSINCLQFCDTQNILVTGSNDKTLIVWDLCSGSVIRTLQGHTLAVSSLQFDNTKLVSGSHDRTLKIWNYRTGQCVRTLEGHAASVLHLHFNSQILASGSADANIKIWNFQTGECYTLTGHTRSVNHVHIQQDSTALVSGSADGTIRMWDLTKRTCTRVFEGHLYPVQAVKFSPPGFQHKYFPLQTKPLSTDERKEDACERSSTPLIFSCGLDKTIKVWSADRGECLRTLMGHSHGIQAFSHDNLRLVSGSADGDIKVWDAETGDLMYSMSGHKYPITALGLSDTKVISATKEGELRIWDFASQL